MNKGLKNTRGLEATSPCIGNHMSPHRYIPSRMMMQRRMAISAPVLRPAGRSRASVLQDCMFPRLSQAQTWILVLLRLYPFLLVIIPAVLSRMEKQNTYLLQDEHRTVLRRGWWGSWHWSTVTFVVYNGEVWMNSKFWHQLKEKFVSSRRFIFVNCTHSLYQL